MRGARDVEGAVIAAVAHACRLDVAAVGPSTRLLDLGIDSLTLVYVLTTVQADLETDFDAADVGDAASARDVRELARAVEQAIRRLRK